MASGRRYSGAESFCCKLFGVAAAAPLGARARRSPGMESKPERMSWGLAYEPGERPARAPGAEAAPNNLPEEIFTDPPGNQQAGPHTHHLTHLWHDNCQKPWPDSRSPWGKALFIGFSSMSKKNSNAKLSEVPVSGNTIVGLILKTRSGSQTGGISLHGMVEENVGLREELSERYDFSRIIGNSGPMRQVYEQIAQVACTNATVLVSGESGTGKELVAHALHINSPRSGRPFVKVNCGALAESLIESELFGHERGAFTGAVSQKRGRFELADGGTLLLDEIGELSSLVQAKLLRVVQTGEFERVGGTETIKVDARLVGATNRE